MNYAILIPLYYYFFYLQYPQVLIKSIGIYPTELDVDGNLLYITDGEKMAAYTYDARNRLIQSGRMKYRYNWRNERIETVWKGKVTRYVVDDSSELSKVLMEQDGDGKVIAYYVYGLGLIGREDGATGQYQSYHSDIRGSTTFLTDEQGKISDRYSYGYYGEVLAHEGSTHQPFQYNGRDGVMHDANGLYYMRARYYHPELKRFLNRDVLKRDIWEGQTLNRYAYVNGEPVSYVDPLGLEKQMVGSDCSKTGTRKLSDPNPIPKVIREQYEEILLNNGIPRIDRRTNQQTIFEGREGQGCSWVGSLEFDVPGTYHRILLRPDGKMGYAKEHDHRKPKLFPGPWYPEGGK